MIPVCFSRYLTRIQIGQGDRTMLIPIVHQILANPEGNHHFPEWLGMSDLKVLCPVWEAAYYVCRRLIGWTDVGKGLQWFYQNELQTLSDPRLKLLKSITIIITNGLSI